VIEVGDDYAVPIQTLARRIDKHKSAVPRWVPQGGVQRQKVGGRTYILWSSWMDFLAAGAPRPAKRETLRQRARRTERANRELDALGL
jgi:hypothetical protein